MLLTDQRLIISHETFNAIQNIYWNWKEWNFSSSCEKYYEEMQGDCFCGEHNCQQDFRGRQNDQIKWSEIKRMNGTNMYMKTSQKRKCDSDTDDGMENTNDLKTVDR